MSQNTHRAVPILLVLFLVVPFTLLALKFFSGDGGRGDLEPNRAVAEGGAQGTGAVELQASEDAGQAADKSATRAPERLAAETRDRAMVDPALAPQRIAGQVRLAANHPGDEQAVVVALAKKTDPRAFLQHPYFQELALELAGLSSTVPEFEKLEGSGVDLDSFTVLGAAAVDNAGRFELELAPGTEVAHLLVSGRYHFSPSTLRVELPTEDVELVCQLGLWITGRVRSPAGVPAERFELELGPDVFTSGFNSFEMSQQAQERNTRTNEDGTFEFRGLPTAIAHGVVFQPEGQAAVLETGIRGEPGEHVRLEVALTPGATLRGKVLDDEGAAVPDVVVTAALRGALGQAVGALRETVTQDDGSFLLENVMPGELDLNGTRAGYITGKLSLEGEVKDGEQRSGLLIELDRGAQLTGRVVFPDGTPAAGFQVNASPDIEGASGLEFMSIGRTPSGKATADEQGHFEMSGLGKAKYVLSAGVPANVRKALEAEESGETDVGEELDLEAWDPDHLDWYARLGGIRPEGVEVELVLERFSVVKGTVVDVAGAPVTDYVVDAIQQDVGGQFGIGAPRRREPVEEQEDGSFEILGLPNGTWNLRVTSPDHAPSEDLPVLLTAGGDPVELVVTLRPAATAVGIVLGTDGQPMVGARVSQVKGMAALAERSVGGVDDSVMTNGEGRFRITGLPPGNHELKASMEHFADSENAPFEAVAGEETEELVLTLRVGGKVTVEVLGAEAVPMEGRMVIVQRTPDYSSQFMGATDSKGIFELEHVTPGSWQVVAMGNFFQDDMETDEENPMGNMLDGMQMDMLDVLDGEEYHVILGAQPKNPVVVRGHVTHADAPVKAAMISFVPEDAEGLGALKIKNTGADGSYEVTLDHPGTYLVTVQKTVGMGLQNSIEYLEVIPEDEEGHELELALPTGRITGTVRGPDGDPLASARVTLTVGDGIAYGSFLGGHYTETVTKEDGSYELEYLDPGTYNVAAGGAAMAGLFGEEVKGGRIVHEGIHVDDGQHLDGVDFRLEEPTSLVGRVVDSAGKPQVKAAVFLRNEDGLLVERFSMTETDSGGIFRFPGLAPGQYSVLARRGELASAPSRLVRSTVEPATSPQVEVQLESGSTLLVSVEDKTGDEVRARIKVVDPQGREYAGMMAMSEILEQFGAGFSAKEQRVGPLPPGRYKVTATTDDGRSVTKPVTVGGQAERKLRLRLR